jgi:hypothetical protein
MFTMLSGADHLHFQAMEINNEELHGRSNLKIVKEVWKFQQWQSFIIQQQQKRHVVHEWP